MLSVGIYVCKYMHAHIFTFSVFFVLMCVFNKTHRKYRAAGKRMGKF